MSDFGIQSSFLVKASTVQAPKTALGRHETVMFATTFSSSREKLPVQSCLCILENFITACLLFLMLFEIIAVHSADVMP